MCRGGVGLWLKLRLRLINRGALGRKRVGRLAHVGIYSDSDNNDSDDG